MQPLNGKLVATMNVIATDDYPCLWITLVIATTSFGKLRNGRNHLMMFGNFMSSGNTSAKRNEYAMNILFIRIGTVLYNDIAIRN
jgi:hypothetical protein